MRWLWIWAVLLLLLPGTARAIDYRVEKQEASLPEGSVAAEQAARLAPQGVRVIRGSSTTLCDFWPVKEIPVMADFEPTAEVLYPFLPGQLLGVVQFARKSSDFRDQDVDADVYTVRYGQQPVDGAHVGTSPTRDFFVLIRAELDVSTDPLDYKKMTRLSAESAGSNHPLICSLQRLSDQAEAAPFIRYDEAHEWWIVRLECPVKVQDKVKPLPIEFVVVGKFAE